jgi:hypothetical protein
MRRGIARAYSAARPAVASSRRSQIWRTASIARLPLFLPLLAVALPDLRGGLADKIAEFLREIARRWKRPRLAILGVFVGAMAHA